MKSIPVTILTGFLGAGKTTLLNHIMQENTDEKVVIIVNELGDENIDHQLVVTSENESIYQLNNGCMCCVVREDLHDLFIGILLANYEKNWQIDRIIIETSGLAEAGPIVQTILRTSYLDYQLVVDSVLTLVDSKSAFYQIRNFTESVQQIAYADRIFLTKTNLVNSQQLKLVEQAVQRINPFAEVSALNIRAGAYPDFIGLDLFNRAQGNREDLVGDIDNMLANEQHNHEDHDHHHDHDHQHSDVNAFSIVVDGALDDQKLAAWFQMLIMVYSADLLRYKGIFYLKNQKKKAILQGVNDLFSIEIEDEMYEAQDDIQSKIVIIGKDLPEKVIKELFVEAV